VEDKRTDEKRANPFTRARSKPTERGGCYHRTALRARRKTVPVENFSCRRDEQARAAIVEVNMLTDILR
jgi:hypothetical protein